MKNFYEAYGEYARTCSDPLILAGRNRFQRAELEAAIADVRHKLQPAPTERFLDVGCNIGMFLEAFAGDFAELVGQDHEDLLRNFEARGVPANVKLHPGFWPEVQAEGMFDCILAYSVLMVLPNAGVADAFVDACLKKLNPGGRLLLGDLANEDTRARFLASEEGRKIARAYDEQRQKDRAEDTAGEYTKRDAIHKDLEIPPEFIDDHFVMRTVLEARQRGFDAYVLPQPDGLPFCRSREDILIVRRR